MKKCTTILLILIVGFFYADLSAQKIDIYNRPIQEEPSRDFDVLHYRVILTFDLDNKRFEGRNEISLTPFRDGLDQCTLHVQELTVTDVKSDSGQSLDFQQTDTHLHISFLRSYEYDDTVKFTVFYYGVNPKQGLYFDDKTERHPQMVSTVSFPNRARHWFPCYDHPHDKATQEMIITVQDPLKVLSNGRFVDMNINKENGTRTYHWHQDLPHSTYLAMLAIGPFAVIKDSLGPLPVNYWVYPQDEEEARWVFRNTPKIIRFFSDLFDYPYPWAKYDQVVSPRQGGGAEATSATVLGERVIYDKKAEQDFSSEKLIAHELGHQWWGDLITLRYWEQTWLNESFGTYSDYLYTRFAEGEDVGAWDLKRKKEQYLREAHTRYMRPIVFKRWESPGQNFDSHTYPKGAVVMHMLRFILGDDPFFRTLSYFLHQHAFQPVDTHDFMKAVKEATGQNMDWFFHQYLFKPGHPVFNIRWTWDESQQEVHLQITQIQDTKKGIPIYRTPVIIGIHTDEGESQKKIWIEKQEEIFSFPAEQKPMMVRFDVGNFLLKEWTFEKDLGELLYQLKHDDVIGRAWAASELSSFSEEPGVIQTLAEQAEKDPFWGVRKTALTNLADTKPKGFRNLYRNLCTDPNSQVRTEALRILGETGDSSLVSFFKERYYAEDSYRAQAEAVRSVGKCGSTNDLKFLKKAAMESSYRNIIGEAAEWAIEQIQSR